MPVRTASGCFAVLLCFAALLPMCEARASNQPPSLDQMLSDLEQVRRFSGISISPDGRWVAWNQSLPGKNTGNELFVADRRDPSLEPRRLRVPESTPSTHNERVVWSPDSLQIAFLSRPEERGQNQVFEARVADGLVRKMTSLKGYAAGLRWSSDGRQLAFLYAENGGGGGPLNAEAARVGEVDEALHNQRITVMPAPGGDLDQVSPPELNVYECDWSSDGRRFAAIAAPGPADNNWWIAKLYTLDLADRQMRLLYQPKQVQQIAIPRWSPDGSQIAFIGGLMSDEGFIGGDVLLVSATGGLARDLTQGAKSSASSLHWQGTHDLIFTAATDGGGSINRLHLADGTRETLWKGEEDLHEDGNYPDLALASSGIESAVIRSTWQHPPEVWSGPLGDWRQLTHANDGQRPQWGRSESVKWGSGAYQAQGWLLYPEHYDPNKRYPMVVSIHGGPSSEHSPSWPTTHFDMSLLSGLGYFVFFPNPRGSYGEGEAFTRANVRDFGGGDLKDILAGVDAVIKKVPVDANRIGVTGWSYGGFMTMWTVTQTNRFHAAVAGAGISDWLSYYGENSIDQWMIPFFGASVYDDPAVYAKSSPITYIKRVKTPTMVLVGERDAECPAPQSFEFWHALKALGTPTKLVVYPGEGHAFDDPNDNLDRLRRTVEWFDRYLGNSAKLTSH